MIGYWLLRCLVAALIFLPVCLHAHDIYSNWRMPDQRGSDNKRTMSCCNNIDCAPRASRYKDGGWQVQFENRWIRVPDQKVETNYDDAWEPGDHMGHACISKSGHVYCFRPGEDMN